MKDTTVRPTAPQTVPATPPTAPAPTCPQTTAPTPEPAAAPAKDSAASLPAAGSAAPTISLTGETSANADNGHRFALGLDYSQANLRGFSDTATVVRIHGAHSRTFAGDANGHHAAMVYQAGIGGGGKSDSVHVIDIAAGAAVRGALAVTSGGSQIYGQVGPSGHITTAADDKRDNPVTMAGVGGRVEVGYAMAYGPDVERRIQIAATAEAGLTGVEYGISVRALSF